MKPVLVFRHVSCEGPAYLARFLQKRSIPIRIIDSYLGYPVPEDPGDFSGLVFMGGPMSVNDELPWILDELHLIQKAHDRQLPLLGHCLGGQLISKALGGQVTMAPVQEIGWFRIFPVCNQGAPSWLQDLDYDTEIFHWHGEQFSLPAAAVPLFRSAHCEQQGFVMGNTMALQCHVEMEQADIPAWLDYYRESLPEPDTGVQSAEEMLRNVRERVARLQQFADKLYTAWIKPLETSSA